MMDRKRISTYILVVISSLLLLPSVASAQRRKPVTTVNEDSIAFFRGIAVGTDVVGPAMRLLANYGQYEAMVRVNIKDRYYPIVEIGVGQADKTDETTGVRFKTSAPYARVGVDFNVLKNKHDIYRFLVGGRLGYTSFKYDVTSPGTFDPVWHVQVPYEANGVSIISCGLKPLEGLMPRYGVRCAWGGVSVTRLVCIRKQVQMARHGMFPAMVGVVRHALVLRSMSCLNSDSVPFF